MTAQRFVFQRDGVMTDCEIVRLESAAHMWGFEAHDRLSSFLAGQRVMRSRGDTRDQAQGRDYDPNNWQTWPRAKSRESTNALL